MQVLFKEGDADLSGSGTWLRATITAAAKVSLAQKRSLNITPVWWWMYGGDERQN
jgi:hypothetical protein